MKDAQYNLEQTSFTSSCISSLSSFPPLSLSASPHSFVPPLSLFSASAPPCNHAGSWLSFGVVYIAVIVRVQYGDWAEHVYSLTGLLCNKSSSGGRGSGWGKVVDGGAGVCVRARKHLHAHKDTSSYKQCLNNTQAHREGDKIAQAPKKRHCANL